MTDTLDVTHKLIRAVIYAADPHDIVRIDRCMQYLHDRRYLFAGLLTGPEHFAQAQQMVTDGQAAVLIMAGCGEVPPRALPGWEFVSHEIRRRNAPPAAADTGGRSRLRRPRPV